jgi:hypothetical protein
MNDLIGLAYGWGCRPNDGSGKTDCFQLTCEARRRMGLSDYADKFAWVYDRYDDATFPRRLVLRWLLENGNRITQPRAGAVALLPGFAGAALGAVTDHGVLFLGGRQNVVHTPVPAGAGHYFWMQ